MKERFLLGEEEMGKLAEKVLSLLEKKQKSSASVLLLEGDLGAGKTTFTKALAEHLGVDKEVVHSPTFILKKQYTLSHKTFKRLVHVDAYRFTHPNEGNVLRLEEDAADPEAVIVIEWPSKMNHLASDIEMQFVVEDEHTREVTLLYEEGF